MSVTKERHKPMCVTMTVEEAAELKRMALQDGTTISGWLAAQVRAQSPVEFPERRGRGISIKSGDE